MARRVFPCLVILGLLSLLVATDLRADSAPSDEFVQQIIKLLGDKDREFRAAGLEQVRKSAKGVAATKQFAAQLPKLDQYGQVALLRALADRGDVTALPSIYPLISSSASAEVKAAGLAAVGKLGSAKDVPLLVQWLHFHSTPEQAAARRSLIVLSGNGVSKAIIDQWKGSPALVKAPLLEVLATRRDFTALVLFVPASVDANAEVRTAAMNALGNLGRAELLPLVLPGVLKAQPGAERDNAERNVAEICARTRNEDERGAALIKALNSVSAEDRDQLLSLVGRVGGRKLIAFVRDVATSRDAARRKLGIDALSKWPDSSTADTLLDIATNATDPAERTLAFQGYVRIAALRDKRSDKQRLERMQQAMKAAKTPEEKTAVINRVRSAYDVGALRFVLPYVDQPQFAQTACETIVEIAHHREVRDPNKVEFDKALDKVIRTSRDPIVVERAQRYKRGETWDRAKKK